MCTNVHTHTYAYATHVSTRAYAHVRACILHLLLVALIEELKKLYAYTGAKGARAEAR
jgi:uncharacterized membrane protein